MSISNIPFANQTDNAAALLDYDVYQLKACSVLMRQSSFESVWNALTACWGNIDSKDESYDSIREQHLICAAHGWLYHDVISFALADALAE